MVRLPAGLLLVLALLVDASRMLVLPSPFDAPPVLFVAVAVASGLSRGMVAGAVRGFAGGLALGLLFGGRDLGALALAGFLAATLPVAVRPMVYWYKWTGQAILGGVGAVVFSVSWLGIAALQRGTGLVGGPSLPALLAAAVLTGAACPLLLRAAVRLEGVR